eukprot:jgi/Mesvir1/14086/Mv14779-RA.1
MLTRLNPFEMGRFFKFVSTVSEMGHNILEFQILNPVTGAYEALGSIAPEYRQLPKHYDGEDYRPTYMKIAEYSDDDLPLDSTQSWTFSDRAGSWRPSRRTRNCPLLRVAARGEGGAPGRPARDRETDGRERGDAGLRRLDLRRERCGSAQAHRHLPSGGHFPRSSCSWSPPHSH